MSKIDFKKKHKNLYSAPKDEFVSINVPRLSYLQIDGKGDPNTSNDYKEAVEALYGIAYGIKMSPRKGIQIEGYFDYVVPPLEGLWFVDDMTKFKETPKSEWNWTMMLMQPKFVTEEIFQKIQILVKEKKENLPIGKVRLEDYFEGQSAQTLYIGDYKDEGPTIQKLHKYIEKKEGVPVGKHHEIYLSDPRRVEASKLKTIIRQPYKSV